MKLGIYVHINVGTLMSIRRGHGLHRNSMEKQGLSSLEPLPLGMLKVNRHPKSILCFSKFVSQEPIAIIVVNDKIKPTIYTRKDNNKIYLAHFKSCILTNTEM